MMRHLPRLLSVFIVFPLLCLQPTTRKEWHQRPRQAPLVAQDGDEISYLLCQLYETVIIDDSKIRIDGPSDEDQKEICRRLIGLADESLESRSRVIQALIEELGKPEAKKGFLIAIPWVNVVRVLGKLKAVEAIDTLVSNIGFTGQKIVISESFNPTYHAVVMMGEAAIQSLTEEVLSDHDSWSRTWAAWALCEIGGNEARQSLELAVRSERDEWTQQELQRALTFLI